MTPPRFAEPTRRSFPGAARPQTRTGEQVKTDRRRTGMRMARDAVTQDVFWEDDFGWEGPGRVAAPPRTRRSRSAAPRPRRRPAGATRAPRRRPAPAARRQAVRRAQIRRRRVTALAAVCVLVLLGLAVVGRPGGSAQPAAPQEQGSAGSQSDAPAKVAGDGLSARPGARGADVRALQ